VEVNNYSETENTILHIFLESCQHKTKAPSAKLPHLQGTGCKSASLLI